MEQRDGPTVRVAAVEAVSSLRADLVQNLHHFLFRLLLFLRYLLLRYQNHYQVLGDQHFLRQEDPESGLVSCRATLLEN